MKTVYLSGKNDFGIFGDGWYGVERSPEGIPYRASMSKGEIFLPVEGDFLLTLMLSARSVHSGFPLRVTVGLGTNNLFDFELNTNGWTTRVGNVCLSRDDTFTVSVDKTWSPDELYRNGDVRALGVLLSSITLSQ